MTRTFKVFSSEARSKTIEAKQHATFTHYIQGIQFRFVVTQCPGADCVVTHRGSGKKVADVPPGSIFASLGDYAVAGKAAMNRLVEKYGAARVRAVLAASEA